MQHIVKFVRVAHVRPRLFAHFRDGRLVQSADFRKNGLRQHAPHFDGARAAFLEWRVVQIGVRIRVQNLVRELRRNGRVHGETLDSSFGDRANHFFEAINIHRLGESILHRLANQRMVGDHDLAGNIFLAGESFGKHRGQKIIGAHSLDLRWHSLAAHEAQQGESAARVPAPARGENRRREHGLFERFPHGCCVKEMESVREREAVQLA